MRWLHLEGKTDSASGPELAGQASFFWFPFILPQQVLFFVPMCTLLGYILCPEEQGGYEASFYFVSQALLAAPAT